MVVLLTVHTDADRAVALASPLHLWYSKAALIPTAEVGPLETRGVRTRTLYLEEPLGLA